VTSPDRSFETQIWYPAPTGPAPARSRPAASTPCDALVQRKLFIVQNISFVEKVRKLEPESSMIETHILI
jgi:hypothetical protein